MRFFRRLSRLFEAQHPEIRVRLQFVPFNELKPRYAGSARENTRPDLIYLMNDWIGELAEKKLLAPLPETFPGALPFARQGVRYRGQSYAQPFVFQVTALIRNTTLLPTAPQQLSDIQRSARGIYPLMYDNRNFYFHAPLFHAFGGRLFDARGNFILRQQPLRDSLRYALDLERQGTVPAGSTASATLNLFSSGQAAAMISGPWGLAAPRDNGIAYAVSPWPRIRGERVPLPFVGLKAFALNPWSRKQAMARHWLTFMARPEIQREALRELDNLPVLASLYTHPGIPAEKKNFYLQALQAVPLPNDPVMQEVWQEMNWLLYHVFRHPHQLESLTEKSVQHLQQKARAHEHHAG
jgi:maltose-binding protein MalE